MKMKIYVCCALLCVSQGMPLLSFSLNPTTWFKSDDKSDDSVELRKEFEGLLVDIFGRHRQGLLFIQENINIGEEMSVAEMEKEELRLKELFVAQIKSGLIKIEREEAQEIEASSFFEKYKQVLKADMKLLGQAFSDYQKTISAGQEDEILLATVVELAMSLEFINSLLVS